MDKPISFAFSLFTGKYEKFLLMIFIVQVPILMFHSFLTNFIYAITPSAGGLFSVADIYYSLITLFMFLYVQIPFVKFTVNENEGREKPLKNAFYIFVIQGFNLFVFITILSFVTVIGFIFYMIPGIILLSVFITAPIIALIDEKSVWKSVKESMQIFRKHHIKIILFISLFGLTELIIGTLLNYAILSITTSYAAILIAQIFLNTIFFPVFVVILTCFVLKWREGLSSLHVHKNEVLV
ncbi:hypothetical protein [Bacillus sp. FJAT-50079]|uniref:hypothetical protein n=1 Tax=Bacillus sp. FJAT-50079 TaxID=2833577 RepID=UPI001BC8F806|nr:hypothetical protein [Bacillus sp. FJAT-50079]MBS4210374.1 hypothetical protein [Bacillus sp. FJAT-50079]